ncbi:hypothetical protein GCM10010389_48790 [Streptomyces echinoruber]|uniref:Uncharacterized protein n=1 Tax=Streptomyces echinoruber TaxID=68898 RepID=A0A918VJC9_9ACTN|nr:hypothetical protein GCM10010389_48790 [Streptomyces echinoruber]
MRKKAEGDEAQRRPAARTAHEAGRAPREQSMITGSTAWSPRWRAPTAPTEGRATALRGEAAPVTAFPRAARARLDVSPPPAGALGAGPGPRPDRRDAREVS